MTSSEMKDVLCSIFPHYTEQMWDGDLPAGVGHKLPSGGYADRWSCRYGDGETSGDSVLWGSVNLSTNISVFVCGDHLEITDIRASGVWGYDSRGEFDLPGTLPQNIHQLDREKVEKILATEFPGRFWQLVRTRALQIYNGIDSPLDKP